VALNDVSMSVPPPHTISRNPGIQPAPITKHATLQLSGSSAEQYDI